MSDLRPPSTTASALQGRAVVLGSRVRVRHADGDHEHTIVTRVTADAPLGCVFVASPVGMALLGRSPGEQVQVHTPGGVRLLTIVNVTAAPTLSSPRGPAHARREDENCSG